MLANSLMISVRFPRSWRALAILWLILPKLQAEVVVPPSSPWKYFKGRTEASSPDTSAWRVSTFNDSAWTTGNTPFFYGEAIAGGTLLSDMQGSYSSVFLRKTFTIADVAQITAADLDVRVDDGFVAWINGQQVASKNPPAAITFDALASANAPEPAAFETFGVPVTALRSGENLIAIQVFNVSLAGSSDILLDAQLVTKEKETIAPRITRVSPAQGAVTNLTQISVTFSETVVGVTAGDLRINDTPATSVTGSGADYTFSFPQPLFGDVQVIWALDANIFDTAVPPNAFNRSDPSASFYYELIDPTVPFVASVYPPQGIALNNLSEVEILFNKPVAGVDAADLLVNGAAATNLVGFGPGPYRFTYPAQPNGLARISWAANHGITDETERRNPYQAIDWNYTVNSALGLRGVRINEFMAANVNGLLDHEASAEDWIELYNEEDVAVSLEGWSLTDDPAKTGQWVFPRVTIGPKQYLVVFASGKDIRDPSAARLHTNFKLDIKGEYLGLFNTDAPRRLVQEFAPAYPEQRNDFSYGQTTNLQWRYFQTATPGAANGASSIADQVEPVHFSVERGFFNLPFQLSFYCPTPGAVIRYTMDGQEPTETIGTNYVGPLVIDRTRIVRAAAFKANSLPSVTRTHTYLFNVPASRMRLPAMSVVTASNHLYGATGIMEVNPRNTTKHGIAWERPVSVELIRPEDNGGFQIDCGIRIQGGGYIRERYDYRTTTLPQGKYSFRLYFRGDYGAGKLDYPLFPEVPLESFDEIVLRAGMNDASNPFIRDETVRMLASDMGMVASHGMFAHFFLNGVYKGLYNPTERISAKFLQAWHGGGEGWDVIAQNGEVRDGDAVAWNQLRTQINSQNPTNQAVYEQISARLDIDNLIDYLLLNIYVGSQDWPYNNWRAGRERAPNGKYRFYVWDAEWSFGYNNTPTHNTIVNELAGTSEIPTMYRRLRLSPEFRLRFADRAHKHFFNGGTLTDEKIRARYESIRAQVASSIPSFNNVMSTTWIAQRRRNVTNHIATAGLLLSSNAPVFSIPPGRIARSAPLALSAGTGEIWFTTNGVDPRVPFTGAVHPQAQRYATPIALGASALIKARTLWSTNWSALTEGTYQFEQLGSPIRITEIMYNPPGGDAYEFIELQNAGPNPVDLGGCTFEGITYRFPDDGQTLAAGARLVLSSSLNPAAFAQRYPQLRVFGNFTGALNNGGEAIILRDRTGQVIAMVEYNDADGWPSAADGGGYSLELLDANADSSAPSNWRASAEAGGSPGTTNSVASTGVIRLNEIFASGSLTNVAGASDWIELHNTSNAAVDVAGWSVSDDSDPRRFVLPAGSSIAANGFLIIWCDNETNKAGLHSGFGLDAERGSVFLHDRNTNRVDALTYGLQIPTHSSGRGTDAAWTLTLPTPNLANEPVTLSTALAINEVLPNPIPGEDDWLEIYNTDPNLPAGIGGFYLSISNEYSRLPELSFIPPAGYVQIFADENSGPDHISFKLPASGATMVLSDDTGAEVNRFSYGLTRESVSYGRLPNGTGGPTEFPASSSPGRANYLPDINSIQISEVLVAGTGGDWLEIFNPLATAVDLSGMSIAVGDPVPQRWQFAAGTTLAAGAFMVVQCDAAVPATNSAPGFNVGEALNDKGEAIFLFDRSGQVIDFVQCGAQLPNRSIGRSGAAWVLLSAPTPGTPNALPATLGDPGLVRINEWMAAPLGGDDWFELYNPQNTPVNLGGLFLTDDPTVSGRTNSQIAQLTFIAPAGFILLQADDETDKGPEHVAFSLDTFGETLRLYNNIAIVDEVTLLLQQPGVSEGRIPDGGSNIVSFPGLATPAGPNALPTADGDNDGLPDDWERAYGLNAGNPADALLDTDGDGMSNLNEYRAGTLPNSASSLLSLEVETENSGQPVLRFRAAANKTYSILAVDSLDAADWTRVGDVTAGSEREVQLVDDRSSNRTRFYRIVSPMQP
jgi:hypothetical protein